MHNCKETKRTLIEMAMAQRLTLPAELQNCDTCRQEYASLRNALRVTDQAMRARMPEENFWPDYEAELRQRLEHANAGPLPLPAMPGISILARARTLLTGSIRIPVPLAAVLLVLAGLSVAFAFQSRAAKQAPAVITRTIEVPVVQEKIVTRTVYREKTPRGTTSQMQIAAASRKPAGSLASLAGFKPTPDINLTIIRGSDKDEK